MGFDWEEILGEGDVQSLYEERLYNASKYEKSNYADANYEEEFLDLDIENTVEEKTSGKDNFEEISFSAIETEEEKRMTKLATIILGNNIKRFTNWKIEIDSSCVFYKANGVKLYFVSGAEMELFENSEVGCISDIPFPECYWNRTWKITIAENVISDMSWCIWLLASTRDSDSYEKYNYSEYSYEELCSKLRKINTLNIEETE